MTDRGRSSARPQSGHSEQSQAIAWYSEGAVKRVIVGDVEVSVRFIGRKGRRSRIAISAPAGAIFIDSTE